MNVSEIRDEIQTRAETVTLVRAHDTVPGSVTPPPGGVSAVVVPGSPFEEYPALDDAVVDLNFTVMLLTGRADEKSAQDNLDAFLNDSGAESVRAALEAGHIANVWDYLAVTAVRRYGTYTFGSGADAVTYLGCDLAVTVGCS